MRWLTNAFSLNSLGDAASANLLVRAVSLAEARTLAMGTPSAVGHADTAKVFERLLGTPVPANRATLELSPGDELLIGQLRGPRLPEGATHLPAESTIRWYHALLEASTQEAGEGPSPEAAPLPKHHASSEPEETPSAQPPAETSDEPEPAAQPLDTRTRAALIADIRKLSSWDDPIGVARERAALLARFPGAEPEADAAEADGRAQAQALRGLDRVARQRGPDSPEFDTTARQLLGQWPHLRRKVDNIYDFNLNKANNRGRAARLAADSRPLTTVCASGDHRLPALAPSERWTLLVDETGANFVRPGAAGREGRFVAVLLPERTRLPALAQRFHAANESDETLDRVLQSLLDADVGVLGVTLRDLPDTPGERWVDGVLELVDWTLLLLPRTAGSTVSLDVRVEARGRHVAGEDWEVAARDLLRRQAARDPASVERMSLIIRAYGKRDEPRLAYADLVAHTWNAGTEAAQARLRASGLAERCLMSGSARGLRALWDGFASDRSPSAEAWSALVRDPSSDDPLAVAGVLASRLGGRAREQPDLWERYLRASLAHLDSKAIDLAGLSRELAWLAGAAPDNARLPPVAQHAWARARLAEANHLGATAADVDAEVASLGERLMEERAPLACEGDLHRAVLATNRFDFAGATRAVARWAHVDPRVPGLQMWGRVQSSLGQHEAFAGRLEPALAHFDRALHAFDRLSDPRERARERSQTGVYRAIALMDAPTTSNEVALAALESVVGRVDEAILRLGPSAQASDKYAHHLLLRWAVHRGDPGHRANLVAGAAKWTASVGHPWPLVCLYRALLLEQVGGPADPRSWLTRGVATAWSHEQGPTVRFIGLVVATVLAARGPRDPRIPEALALARAELPAAAGRLERVENELTRPGDALSFVASVLPFNFR